MLTLYFWLISYSSAHPSYSERKILSCVTTEHQDHLNDAESLSISAAYCRHNDCLLALEVNHVISCPFSIIWHWQPFQNIGAIWKGKGGARTDGQTDTEHRQRCMPGTWSFQHIWQQIIWEMKWDCILHIETYGGIWERSFQFHARLTKSYRKRYCR
jgi:hypothetical protein